LESDKDATRMSSLVSKDELYKQGTPNGVEMGAASALGFSHSLKHGYRNGRDRTVKQNPERSCLAQLFLVDIEKIVWNHNTPPFDVQQHTRAKMLCSSLLYPFQCGLIHFHLKSRISIQNRPTNITHKRMGLNPTINVCSICTQGHFNKKRVYVYIYYWNERKTEHEHQQQRQKSKSKANTPIAIDFSVYQQYLLFLRRTSNKTT
jgi:hypothetical protein